MNEQTDRHRNRQVDIQTETAGRMDRLMDGRAVGCIAPLLIIYSVDMLRFFYFISLPFSPASLSDSFMLALCHAFPLSLLMRSLGYVASMALVVS